MTIKFTDEAIPKGYSFFAGEMKTFPEVVAEMIISDGVAYRISSTENKVNKTINTALAEANERDRGHQGNG